MTISQNSLPRRLALLLDHPDAELMAGGLKGIEKESLRISADGFIAQTPHPAVLGAALTHPYITTDYSEALLEFITPPFTSSQDTLAYLESIHQFVYDQKPDEMLLAASMPCGISGDDSVPIAEYGTSNIGRMKHVYRRGLGYRYGRTMQAIAGVHFNYSVPKPLWRLLHELEKSLLNLDQFISDAYFGLIRNLHRQGWLMLYLFGSSPAICKSFFKSRPQLMAGFDEFDGHTLYHPYATSLRMSDIGYKSENQAALKIDYNSLSGYVESLGQAIATPFPDYEKIGVKVDGEYRQLNGNILQIENEFYSTVRPKQIAHSGEKPTLALKHRGVRYIELRSLDLDLFCPIGIQLSTAHFVEAFILTCLCQDSPATTDSMRRTNNANQLAVAHRGREPGLMLETGTGAISLKDWAGEIFTEMQPICALLDQDNAEKPYTAALQQQIQAVEDPGLTPSAQILRQMSEKNQPFATFALKKSAQYKRCFRRQKLDSEQTQTFLAMAELSHARQQDIENSDKITFDLFLQRYFAQK
ncbi:MAG: glutamate--cysteine ligase [Gammaproteobacteria bacterium HGW-Gammaproteobacteria-3]|nr:MAG: glutamate--cysteine ligase [Gammaproteobacteria bacterium HGW-Gammaproteobacteria-3]